MGYGKTCPHCGRNNDPGEVCECHRERTEPKQQKAAAPGVCFIGMVNGAAVYRTSDGRVTAYV